MVYSNEEKFIHGKNAQLNIKDILESCKKNQYITNYVAPYKVGKDGFSNDKQFYAPFLITFPSEEAWIIFSTTSMRTDRIKGNQWDAINIKSINPQVTKAYLVYSDGLPQADIKQFDSQSQKYLNQNEYSAIDNIISQDTLFNFIEKNAISNLDKGKIKDLQGRKFEDRVATILSNKDNLKKYQTESKTLTGLHYPIFYNIISSINITPDKITEIFATTDKKFIKKLPSGGNPKTDVYVEIKTDSSKEIITISCKRSSSKKVSVHEYSAESFSDILNPKNIKLKKLLYEFQANPSLSAFGTKNQEDLTKELHPYLEKLSKWVLAGINGYGDSKIQWATHILTYDNNDGSVSFHTIEEYIDALSSNNISGHFGTFFSWTYPSKKRGKSIQLKCKIIK